MNLNRRQRDLHTVGRVYLLRQDEAARHVQQELEKLSAIQQEIAERQARVDGIEAQKINLVSYLDTCQQQGQQTAAPNNQDMLPVRQGQIHQYWLNYDLDREQYYLDQTREELQEQQQVLQQARARLYRIKTQRDTLDAEQSRLRQKRQAIQETRMDDESGAGA